MSSARDVARTLGTLGLLTAALPVNAARDRRPRCVRGSPASGAPRRRLAGDRRTVLISGGKMTKALALAARSTPPGTAWCWSSRRSTGSPGTGSPARSTPSTPCPTPDATRLRRGAARRSCERRGRRRLRAGLQPGRRACTTPGPRPLLSKHCEVVHVDAGRAEHARRQVRVRAGRRGARAARCPTRTASPTPQQVARLRLPGAGRALHPQEHRLRPGRTGST